MKITPDLLKRLYRFSCTKDRLAAAHHLEIAVNRYDITTSNRLSAFLSVIGHETGHLKALVENLNYSAEGLIKTWPSQFKTLEFARQYAHNPEKIANYVYGNRYGNISPSDGWKFRGRGAIQTTFKDNYRALNNMENIPLGTDFTDNPELLETWDYAALSAAYYWRTNGVNELADILGGTNEYQRFKAIVKRVNGGYIGLSERWELYNIAKKIIK